MRGGLLAALFVGLSVLSVASCSGDDGTDTGSHHQDSGTGGKVGDAKSEDSAPASDAAKDAAKDAVGDVSADSANDVNADVVADDAAEDASGSDATQSDAPNDVAEDDAAPAPDCDDGVACTLDGVDADGGCEHVLDHSKCLSSELCTLSGCVATSTTSACHSCTSPAECSDGEICGNLVSDAGAVSDGGSDAGSASYCLPLCGAGAACPKGFSCDQQQAPARCVPASVCCIDQDGDKHGLGDACQGSDCDDEDPAVYSGNPEICDGKDNDCNTKTDDGFLCAPPICTGVGQTGTYEGSAPGSCVNGACAAPVSQSCGLYTCQPVTNPTGTACRTACAGIDDSACIASAYCDGAACSSGLPDGSACSRDRMCSSAHCTNGFCCATGDCCKSPTDCPSSYAVPAACDSPITSCQGHRMDKTCANYQCGSAQVDDDSACTSSISKPCAPLAPVACNGSATQVPLVCPTSCASDSQCSDPSSMFCQNPGPNGICVSKLPDGSVCTSANQCVHNCLNSHCCNAAVGACCAVAADCPASYAEAPACDGATDSCQGHRKDKACFANQCASTTVDDDTACSSSITKACGAYTDVSCNGSANQSPLTCATSCTSDIQCTTPQFHCYGGACVNWVADGGSCSANAQCLHGNCWNGSVCCNTACNATTCDSCATGQCVPYSDPYETAACTDALYVGSGQFDTSVNATIQSAADGDDWFTFYASDGNNACYWPVNDFGHLIVTLNVPPSVDYDLYVYKGSCSALQLIGSSTSGPGMTDKVDFQEDCGGDDSGYYFVNVRRYTGFSCAATYGLSISAHL